jgi:dTDP-4-amino-4,6-dideoxygalactose transaminase
MGDRTRRKPELRSSGSPSISDTGPSGNRQDIPFNRPFTVGTELAYIAQAIASGHLSGNGPFTRNCTDWLENALDANSTLLTHSGTGALELAALLAEVGVGDEVIMPSFTFTSTANAFVVRAATPVFVDVRPDTLNLDERLVEAAITDRTRAIVPVHYAGIACAMDALAELADAQQLVVIEDAAHAFGASFGGRSLGTFGALAALSFHETKNVICGEGGALIVNEPSLAERAEVIYEKGTNRLSFFRGQVDKYTWVDIGSSFPASELAAAFLWAQLERAEWLMENRLAIWERYQESFEPFEQAGLLRRPVVPQGAQHNGHLYYLLLSSEKRRDYLLEALGREGVHAVFHYVPLHSSPAGRHLGRTSGELPVTDQASATLLRLPLWVGMTDEDVTRVVTVVERTLS